MFLYPRMGMHWPEHQCRRKLPNLRRLQPKLQITPPTCGKQTDKEWMWQGKSTPPDRDTIVAG
jgi:hypothetical protein